MAFQILDSQGNAVTLGQLDLQACNLWGKEVNEKKYAYPDIKPEKFANINEEFDFYRRAQNWFDTIGYMIHEGKTTWNDIRESILKPYKKFPIEEVMKVPGIWGFVQLVNHWESMGYTPKCLTD